MVTFGISGIWHGADLTYVAWGLLNGFCIVAARVLQPVKDFLKKLTRIDKSAVFIDAAVCSTHVYAINFTWIFFRAESFDDAFHIIGNMFGRTYGDMLGLSQFRLTVCKVVPFVLVGTEMCMKTPRIVELLNRSQSVRLVLYALCLSSIVLFGTYDTQAFIYFQF